MTDRTDPRLEPPFAGRIGRTVADSTPSWPARRPGAGPNMVVIVLDDVGFAQLGCYGSSIATPHIDALADGGIRYTDFHVTALCSPTRASLMTGRNHHAVGVGFLADYDTGYPSYRGAVTARAATIAEVLRDAGYGTYLSGKWHLTPPGEMSPAGPFQHWPTQRGFDRYYGFLWGEDDQYQPELWYDQHRVDPPRSVAEGYHLTEDLVTRAEGFLDDHLTARPDDPFFLYLALGACHAPHQAPERYRARYRGAFDHGWDEERRRTLARQVELGVVPEGTALPERNPGVPAWDGLDPDRRRLYARMQEAFAGFMTHTDEQIGALVGHLRRRGLLEDTLVVLMSDNGASGEGGEHGSANEYRYFLGLEDPLDDALAAIDELGGPSTHNHYPAGWAQAGNTPLRYYKKHTHGGGVRAPLIVHWPRRVSPATPLRRQFHHVIDLAPTLAELAGTSFPDSYRGIEQLPVHGTSLAYTFADPAAPSTRQRQYFETAGYRGIVVGEWKAVAVHQPGTPFDADRWELFHLPSDFSETDDRADAEPALAAELAAAWWAEAERYDVLPLDDRMAERIRSLDPGTDARRYRLLPGSRLLNAVVGPNYAAREFRVTARWTRLSAGQGGVVLAYGRRASGFALFVQDDRLVFDYNLAGRHTVVASTEHVPVGPVEAVLEVVRDGDGARARLCLDGREVGAGALPQLMPGGLGCQSTQCGHNAPSPVSAAYAAPYRFEGELDAVTIELGPQLADTSHQDWAAGMAIQ
jgi:arylsulfatase